MGQDANTFRRCADMVALLNDTEGWELSEEEALALADVASTYVPPEGSDTQLRTVIANIRHDHLTVDSLRQSGHMCHAEAWARWMGQARAILCHAGLNWARDGAVDVDDLAQVALLELVRSLPGFRYQSRFSTWAYQVITKGVQRHLRDISAQKRVGEIDATVDPLTLTRTVAEGDLPDAQVEAQLLAVIVDAELIAAIGQRNTQVFQLWACDDLSAEMIGQRVGLSVARVYAVIANARQYLRGRAAIQGWGELSRG